MEFTSLRSLSHYLRSLVETRLWLKVLIGMLLGIGAGVLIAPGTGLFTRELSQTISSWLALPGTLFLKLVQMIMIPLIVASIIQGIVANENMEQLRNMGVKVVLYFLATTTVSITLGLILALSFNPGQYFDGAELRSKVPAKTETEIDAADVPGVKDIPVYITELLPENPLASMVTGEMLSVVIFTVIIGLAMLAIPRKTADPLISMLGATMEVCMTVVKWAMKIVPFAVFGLMAQLVASIGLDSILGISAYVLVVLGGLLILLGIYMLMILIFARANPFTFLSNIRDVQLLAFSTTSSAAVMPLSLKTAEEKLKTSPAINNFLIPIGATINMDGTALYQCIATVFIAQVYGVELSLFSLILMNITIVLASIGTPAIPGGGIIILASILQSSGIPTAGVVIIIGVDRILGMFRTAINVTGDLTACMIFDRWLKKEPEVDMRLAA